jgi:hypothetical protein
MVAAVALWAAAWGPSVIHQTASVGDVAPVPFTSWRTIRSSINALVSNWSGGELLVLALTAAGGAALAGLDRRLSRVWTCAFLVPTALAAVVGLRVHLFWLKTLAFASWGPLLAIAALVVVALRRSRPLALALGLLTALIVVPSTFDVLGHPQVAPTWPPAIAHLQRVVAADDVAAAHPFELRFPVRWYLGASVADGTVDIGLPGVDAFVPRRGRSWSGRVWVFAPAGDAPVGPAGWATCAPPFVRSGYRVDCLEAPR